MSDPKQEERERVEALLDLDTAGAEEEEIVEAAIRDGSGPGETARRILARRRQMRESALAARVGDEEQMEAPGVSTGAREEDAAAAAAEQVVAAGRRAGVLPPPGEGRQRVGEAGGAP